MSDALRSGVDDPDNYAALSIPFETPEEADLEVAAFWDDVAQARQKHKLADVHVIIYSSVMVDGKLMRVASFGHFGNEALGIIMCADGVKEEAKTWKKALLPQPPEVKA